MRDLRAQLLALPGVQAVMAATPLPLDGGNSLARWGTEEALSDASKFQQSFVHIVLPGYFDAMRTRVVEGLAGFDEPTTTTERQRDHHRPDWQTAR